MRKVGEVVVKHKTEVEGNSGGSLVPLFGLSPSLVLLQIGTQITEFNRG